MKELLIFLVVLVLSITFVACKSTDDSTLSSSQTSVTEDSDESR